MADCAEGFLDRITDCAGTSLYRFYPVEIVKNISQGEFFLASGDNTDHNSTRDTIHEIRKLSRTSPASREATQDRTAALGRLVHDSGDLNIMRKG